MNNVIQLNHPNFTFNAHQVRTILIDGEPWFVLNDLCSVLDIGNPHNVVARLDPEYLRKTEVLDGRGLNRETNIVNESGMYEVVIRSNAPVAKTFRKWVIEEVLPTIRKTGKYSIVPETPAHVLPQSFSEALRALAENVDAREAAEARNKELEPKADYADMISESEGLRTITDLLNDLKLHAASNHPGVKVVQNDVFDLAGELGLIIRGNTVRNNQPTARAVEAKWVRPHEVTYERKSGGTGTKRYTRLTPRGYARIWEEAVTRLRNNQPIFTPKAKVA